jgi:glycosyltransferase involved in cell wall biosynthesis
VKVALVHDYLTQRGGAERVALTMAAAFPGAPLYTSLYEPSMTFPEFGDVDVRPLLLNRFGVLRHDHRRALPFLARSFRQLNIDADVVVCSSSGWAHGVRSRGAKVVYCHTPARWLYQSDRYLEQSSVVRRAGLHVFRSPLVAWDRAAARTATRYLANSTLVRERIRDAYGVDAEVLPPPHVVDPSGPQRSLGFVPGFFLCVARLLSYKNVDAILGAFAQLPDERLVVVGSGPDAGHLRAVAPANVTFLEGVADTQLRWLYASCRAVVAASYEDFGLTPLEGGSFGKPAIVLRYGGFLDTVQDGVNGVFFDEPEPDAIAAAVASAADRIWDASQIRAHSKLFAPEVFIERLRSIVEGVA